MKQIPILFSTEMVRAILEGRKTMTRRVVKPQPIDNTEVDGNFFEGNHKGYVKVDGHPNWRQQFAHEFARWKVGDQLWVRETWFNDAVWGTPKFHYLADGSFDEQFERHALKQVGPFKWRPSIHMPKDAARIWLEVVNVRVERLHDISEEDAVNEGIECCDMQTPGGDDSQDYYRNYLKAQNESDWPWITGKPIESFKSLWIKINGEESWDSNPWVWVVEFKVISTKGYDNGAPGKADV